jgi:alpha-tubulin suppressor-like RCC1 family protein
MLLCYKRILVRSWCNSSLCRRCVQTQGTTLRTTTQHHVHSHPHQQTHPSYTSQRIYNASHHITSHHITSHHNVTKINSHALVLSWGNSIDGQLGTSFPLQAFMPFFYISFHFIIYFVLFYLFIF